MYDGPFCPFPKTGVELYFNRLASLLSKNRAEISFSRRHYDAIRQCSSGIRLPLIPHFRPHRFSFFCEYLINRMQATGVASIVHPTEFGLSPTGSFFWSKGAKVVITIHDLIHEKFGAPGNLYNPTQRLDFYSMANGYIFVSQSTKNDFSEHYPSLLDSKPSKVIRHGCNFETQTIAPKKKKQFLFVGSREGYKNFPNACLAFERTAAIDSDCSLAVVGSPPNHNELEWVEKFGTRIKWFCHPSHQILQNLYADSLGLLYVSKYEGFGMPLLEAMSQGCVPIAGSHSSIPEVLGDAGIMVDVTEPTEISRAMLECLNNPNFFDGAVQEGLKRTLAFSWSKTAEETLSFYESL